MPAGLPTSITVAVEFTAGVWTALTDVVGDSIEIRVGRESASSDVQPGTLSFTLDNIDGKYTPDNPTSTLYPNWIEGKRVRVQTVVGGTTYTRFVGRITRIEPDFPTVPWSGKCVANAVDLLGELSNKNLGNPLRTYLGTRSTLGVYPLDDTNGRSGAAESLGRLPDMTIRNVSSGGSMDFAGTEYLGSRAVQMTAGKGLWHARGAFTMANASAQGVSAFVFVEDNSYGEVLSLTNGPRSGAVDGILLRWTSSGFVLDDLAGGVTVSSSTAIAADPGWHWVHFAGDVGGGFNLYVDNSITGLTDTSTTGYSCMSLGGSINLGVSMLAFGPGVVDAIAMFAANVTFLGWADLITDSGFTIFDRMSGLDDLGGKTTFTGSIESRRAYSPVQTEFNISALDYLARIARSLGGIVYHEYSTSATQSVVLPTAPTTRPTTVALTVDADADLATGPVMSRDVTRKAASVEVASPIDSVVVIDSTQSGGSPETIDTFLGSTDYLAALGQDYLAQSAATRLRPAQLTLDLATAANNLYAAFYAVTPGERVRLSNLPSTYFGVTYMDGYVEGWTERPGVTGYEVTFDLSPADAPPEGLWDDSTYGRWGFGNGVATNVSSATSSATSVQFSWTGGLTLSTSAGDYPLDLDWNGERITVNSAPAGGSSPQTLSITRGVAPTVARAHNAGESVDIWNAARWAM